MFAHTIAGFTGPDDVLWTEVAEPAADGGVVIDVGRRMRVVRGLAADQGRLPDESARSLLRPVWTPPGPSGRAARPGTGPGSGASAWRRCCSRLRRCWQEVVSPPRRQAVLPSAGRTWASRRRAASPLNYLTALFALDRRAHAQPGDTLLVHGAAGGVGTAAIQLGRALGLRTVAVVGRGGRSEDFALAVRRAPQPILSGGWLTTVRDLIGERAVDIVLDPVGGDRMTDSLRSLAPEGRLLMLGFTAGEIPVVKVNRLLLGNTGVLGAASREFFRAAVRPRWPTLWARLVEAAPRPESLPDPPVEPYPFADARSALRRLSIADRKATGHRSC